MIFEAASASWPFTVATSNDSPSRSRARPPLDQGRRSTASSSRPGCGSTSRRPRSRPISPPRWPRFSITVMWWWRSTGSAAANAGPICCSAVATETSLAISPSMFAGHCPPIGSSTTSTRSRDASEDCMQRIPATPLGAAGCRSNSRLGSAGSRRWRSTTRAHTVSGSPARRTGHFVGSVTPST